MTERIRRSMRRTAAGYMNKADRLLERAAWLRTQAARLYETADLDARIDEADMDTRPLKERLRLDLEQVREMVASGRIAEDPRAEATKPGSTA
jgi:hypothetical protein